ncbi:MAG: hypothetical protein LM583_08955, partial [Desulfurococcaceae archaeon]|nr:hypothetical protein [Desulfurococcaceae archaeon]
LLEHVQIAEQLLPRLTALKPWLYTSAFCAHLDKGGVVSTIKAFQVLYYSLNSFMFRFTNMKQLFHGILNKALVL